jgi:hypothetical protein
MTKGVQSRLIRSKADKHFFSSEISLRGTHAFTA